MNCLGFGNHVPDDEAGHLIEVTDATGALYNWNRYYDRGTRWTERGWMERRGAAVSCGA